MALLADECSTETAAPLIPWAKTPRTQQRSHHICYDTEPGHSLSGLSL